MIDLKLPWPVSTNKAWMPTGRKGFRLNPKASTFRLAVRSIVLAAKLQDLPMLGPLEVTITLCPPNLARRDEDNFAGKSLLDALTKAGVWGDDSQVRAKHVYWGNVVKGGSVLVQIEPLLGDTGRTGSRAHVA